MRTVRLLDDVAAGLEQLHNEDPSICPSIEYFVNAHLRKLLDEIAENRYQHKPKPITELEGMK